MNAPRRLVQALIGALLLGWLLFPPVFLSPPQASEGRYGPASLTVEADWITLQLEGDPYEMGLQQGVLLRPYLRELMATALYPSLQAAQIELGVARRYVRLLWPRLPNSLQAELAGIAMGSALPLEDLLLWNLREELLALGPDLPTTLRDLALLPVPQRALQRGSWPLRPQAEARGPWPLSLPPAWEGAPPAASGGSVAFAFWGATTLEGERWLGGVLAAPPGGERYLLVRRHPEEGQPSVGIALPGEVGLRVGHNAAGLTLWSVPFQTVDRAVEGWSAPFLLRLALEQSQNQDEAAAFLLHVPHAGGSHFLLADRQTVAVSHLAFGARQFQRYPAEQAEAIALGEPLEGPLALTARPLRQGEGAQRGRLARWRQANQGVISEQALLALLEEPALVGERGALTLLIGPDGALWFAQATEGHSAPASGWVRYPKWP